jgi:hypothetical protein
VSARGYRGNDIVSDGARRVEVGRDEGGKIKGEKVGALAHRVMEEGPMVTKPSLTFGWPY